MKIHRSILVLLLLVSMIEISLELVYVLFILGVRNVAPSSDVGLAFFIGILILQVVAFLVLGYRWLADYWVIKPNDIIHVKPNTATESFHPRRVSLIEVNQTRLGRVLDYGEIVISFDASPVTVTLTMVPRPHELTDFLHHVLNIRGETPPDEEVGREQGNVSAELSRKGE